MIAYEILLQEWSSVLKVIGVAVVAIVALFILIGIAAGPVKYRRDEDGELLLDRRGRKLLDPDGVTFHTFRHSMASNAFAAGVPDSVIQKLGNWKDGKMLDRYRHLAHEEVAEATDPWRHLGLRTEAILHLSSRTMILSQNDNLFEARLRPVSRAFRVPYGNPQFPFNYQRMYTAKE